MVRCVVDVIDYQPLRVVMVAPTAAVDAST